MPRVVELVRRWSERVASTGAVRRVRGWWQSGSASPVAIGEVGSDQVAVIGPAPGGGPNPDDARDADATDPEAWWRLLPFTTHRIEFGYRRWSAPTGVDVATDRRTRLVAEACGGSLEGHTIVDLGCLEGGFTIEFARRGALCAVGIEAREVSVRRCELARDLAGVDAARFVRGDVKVALEAEVEFQGAPFDVVLATGILHHLGDPAELLRSMRAACSNAAIVCTHIAEPDRATHGCSDEVATLVSGGREYRGRWFGEYDESITHDRREELLWAAWSDRTSFWPFEEDLVRMILDAGFATVDKVEPDSMTEPWQVDHIARVLYRCTV